MQLTCIIFHLGFKSNFCIMRKKIINKFLCKKIKIYRKLHDSRRSINGWSLSQCTGVYVHAWVRTTINTLRYQFGGWRWTNLAQRRALRVGGNLCHGFAQGSPLTTQNCRGSARFQWWICFSSVTVSLWPVLLGLPLRSPLGAAVDIYSVHEIIPSLKESYSDFCLIDLFVDKSSVENVYR